VFLNCDDYLIYNLTTKAILVIDVISWRNVYINCFLYSYWHIIQLFLLMRLHLLVFYGVFRLQNIINYILIF